MNYIQKDFYTKNQMEIKKIIKKRRKKMIIQITKIKKKMKK